MIDASIVALCFLVGLAIGKRIDQMEHDHGIYSELVYCVPVTLCVGVPVTYLIYII